MRLIKTSIILSIIAISSCASWVFAKSAYTEMPKGTYALDLTHASIVWKVSHLGLSDYTARFTEFDSSIEFDPANIENSSVTATINPLSIQTAYPNPDETDFDKELATSESWFNATKFQNISFKSTSIEMTGESTAIMQGELSLLGVVKPIEFTVTLNGAMENQPFSGKPTLGFSAKGTIQRSEWGMETYVPNIGDSVDIWFEGEFAKAD